MILVILHPCLGLETVEEVVVEVPSPCALKAGIKLLFRAGFIVGLIPGVQLRAQRIALPWMTLHKRFPGSRFRPTVVINIRRIKIGAASRKETIYHLAGLRNVNAAIRVLGQTHQAEAELKDIFPEVVRHNEILLPCSEPQESCLMVTP